MTQTAAQPQSPSQPQSPPPPAQKWAQIIMGIHEALSHNDGGVSLVFDNLEVTLGQPKQRAPRRGPSSMAD